MTRLKYLERSKLPPPKGGLPAPFVFEPPRRGYNPTQVIDGAISEILRWCDEQFGEGSELEFSADLGDRAWGYWPSGTVFFARSAEAMWFRMRWG